MTVELDFDTGNLVRRAVEFGHFRDATSLVGAALRQYILLEQVSSTGSVMENQVAAEHHDSAEQARTREAAVDHFLSIRSGARLGSGVTIRELRDEGRR